MKTTSSTGSRRLLALMLSLLMTFGLWTADLRGAVAHAEVTPIETINDFELNAGGTVKATWDQTAQTLTVHGSGKIENGKWKELARKFSEENFKGRDAWDNNSDFTLRFESNAILLPDDTRIEDDGKFFGFFSEFDGEIELPADFNVSNVTNMYCMFFSADNTNPDVSTWDVSKVTDMSGMFRFTYKANPDVSAWDVSKVENMKGMFSSSGKANPDISAWDVSKVTNMDEMFYSAESFKGDVSGWRPEKLETMQSMFEDSSIEELDLSTWNVSDVDATEAFDGMKDLKFLKFKGLRNVKLTCFNDSYSYTKEGGSPFDVVDPNEEQELEDNATYTVTLQPGAGKKRVTVKFLRPDGTDMDDSIPFILHARKGESFTDEDLFDEFSDSGFMQTAPNTPDKVNTVGEGDNIVFKVQLKLVSYNDQEFVVSFHVGDGTAFYEYIPKNTPVPKPEDPQRQGHIFRGWYKEDTFDNEWSFTQPVNDDMLLFAKWERDTGAVFHTVTVIGGTSDLVTTSAGETVTVTANPAPSGQRFIGWSSDVEVRFLDASSESTDFTMPDSDVTIKANFASTGDLLVIFDSQGGSAVAPAYVAPGTPAAPPVLPTREGYSFEGWYTDTAYTTPWNFSDPVTADMILYAKWSTGTSTYTVRVTGGTSDLATAAAGARVTVTADPAPIGQRFVNWTSDVGVAFANVTTPSTTFVMPSSNVEVTANFAPIGHLAVSFDSQGGSAVAPAYVAPGTPAAPPVPPTRAGYTFDGWYTDTAYTTPWNFSDPVTADMILYAKWNSSTSTGTGSGGGDKDKPEKPEMPKAPKEDLIQKPDIVEVFDESSPKHETKAPSAMKTAGVLKIGSLDYQALEKGVLVKKKLDTPPIIEKGKTMLPARAVGELLGVSVSYNSKSKTAVFVYEGKKVELTIGKKTMKVNGVEKAMSAPMMMRNGRVLLPLRDVQQALKELGLEASVNWEHKTKMITIQAKR
ncbi:InlB B-repeat-containing protein [Filifactor villosus]|uniref:InlB B-repeat-containing protein n=1 Tax=Filifactor villosus TaxID=29374 RepID=A0ABV9QKL9_9FIRM